MNILHLKYAVEVARLGSLSKASETLLTAQPNISRAIKDLEADLGFSLFLRSKSGMTLTPEGEDFIGYARDILLRLDQVEQFLLFILAGWWRCRVFVSRQRVPVFG